MRAWSLAEMFFLVLALAIASVAVNLVQERAFAFFRTWLDLAPAMGAYFFCLTALALSALAVTWRLRNHPVRGTAPGPGGFLLLVSALMTIYGVTNAASFALAARDIYAIELAAADFESADMVPVAPGGLSIVGTIGTTFMSDFRAAENKHGAFSWIELTSPGGLVSEALALAELVETRRTKVIVRGECASACVLIAVASSESYAEADAAFGFHRSSPVAEIQSEIAIFGYEEMDKLADKFLRNHGVTESIMTAAAEHGPDSLLIVGATDMVLTGAIRGIVKDGAVVQTGPKQ
jgi:hypothetical protein